MAARSQSESEQPAKVYQLDAVDAKVDSVITKLDKVLEQTNGLVTTSQLSQSEKDMKDKINEEIDKVHLEYGPLKRNASWLFKTVVALILAALIEGGSLIYTTVLHR